MSVRALAKTLVKGSVTIQGVKFPFEASVSGTKTGINVSAVKKGAVIASNVAARKAARIAINKILAANSDALADLKITNLISNKFTTTVNVLTPIEINTIATSSDGVNYSLNKNVTIGSAQMFTVPVGITLTGAAGNHFTNNGFFQISGNFRIGVKTNRLLKTKISTNYTNNAIYQIDSDATMTIDSGVTFTNNEYGSTILNHGSIKNNGIINNYRE